MSPGPIRPGQRRSRRPPPGRDDLPVYDTSLAGGEVLVGSPLRGNSWYVRRGRSPRRVVILGAGAAGSAAAETLRREGFEGEIVLASAEDRLPYDRTMLSKGFLRDSAEDGDDRLGVRVSPGVGRMDGAGDPVEPARKCVRLEGGEELGYDSLLVATGGTSRRLGLPGENLSGSLTLRSRHDAVDLLAAVRGSRGVVILGAGFLGLELAGSLSERGLAVTVAAPEALPLVGVFGEAVACWILARHSSRGVRFRLGTTARELRGRGRVREVLLRDGSRLEAETVVQAVGIEPQAGFLEGLARHGLLTVDARQRTEAPEVYAAGDLAQVAGSSGEVRHFEHWNEAEAQGRRAARAMLERESPAGGPPFFWTEVGELTLKSVGAARSGSSGASLVAVVRGSLEAADFAVGYYEPGDEAGRLVMACSVGRDRELIALGECIRLGVPITEEQLRDESLDVIGHFSRQGVRG